MRTNTNQLHVIIMQQEQTQESFGHPDVTHAPGSITTKDTNVPWKYSKLLWTVEQRRSTVCGAPFVVELPKGKEKITVDTYWHGNKDTYTVDPDHFAKVHCWVSLIDPRNKGIRCDGINIYGGAVQMNGPDGKPKNYKTIAIEDWTKPEDRIKELINTCRDVLAGSER